MLITDGRSSRPLSFDEAVIQAAAANKDDWFKSKLRLGVTIRDRTRRSNKQSDSDEHYYIVQGRPRVRSAYGALRPGPRPVDGFKSGSIEDPRDRGALLNPILSTSSSTSWAEDSLRGLLPGGGEDLRKWRRHGMLWVRGLVHGEN